MGDLFWLSDPADGADAGVGKDLVAVGRRLVAVVATERQLVTHGANVVGTGKLLSIFVNATLFSLPPIQETHSGCRPFRADT
jgi:hypothetical protein